jgi:membrane associated rhomboid family serine protease
MSHDTNTDRYLLDDEESNLSSPSVFRPPSGPPKQAKKKKNTPKAYEAPVLAIRPQVQQQNQSANVPHNDSIDQMISRVDKQDDDKYRTPILNNSSDAAGTAGSWTNGGSQDSRSMYTTTSDVEKTMSSSFAEMEPHRRDINDLYQFLEEADYYKTKQKFAYLSMTISAFQLLILASQLSLCGVAPLDVNPFVGPYPDVLSQWGGKNPYLMQNGEWWRLVTPAFLNVGVLQLLVNSAVQLETCAFFEREWGWMRYLWIYLISAVGCSIVSCAANPDTVGVGSSGAIMGLFGAKLAQVVMQVCFDFSKREEDSIRLEQLSSVLCSLSVVLGLSFFTYIDWSGHMGGLATGFVVGMIAFSQPIRSKLSRTIWRLLGIILLLTGVPVVFYIFIEIVEPDEDLGDTCEYFRNLYAEGYDCSCSVF